MEVTINQKNFVLRQAREEDLNEVIQLLVNAAKWLKTKGTTQWDYYIHDLEENRQEVLDSIKNGSTYILQFEEKAIASITLENKPNEWDRDIWGKEATENKKVMYLHRIVVHRDYKGNKIGAYLFQWAVDFARKNSKTHIRFDCLESNKGLNEYYQSRFVLKGIANIYGQHCKYEIEI